MDHRNKSRKLGTGWVALPLAALALGGCTSLVAPLLKPKLSAEVTALPAGDWKLDPAHAALVFRINHLGYSDLIGRFESFDVSLTGDASDPASARADAVIDMTSLDIANDSFAQELMGPKFFDTARYPQAVFRTLSVTPGENGGAEVNGELTLHGQTRPVTLDVQFNGTAFDAIRGAQVAGFSASTVIDRTDFGVSAFSGLVTDEVRIEIQAEFLKQ
ncbi:YceI family protein [Hyphomonas jannaschiana]|uniref:YceI family protein n=1 Tax=Hyphomonas jannaschiana TaxID=86 RepID=UPI0035C6CF89